MLNSTDIDTLVRQNQEKIQTLYLAIKNAAPEVLSNGGEQTVVPLDSLSIPILQSQEAVIAQLEEICPLKFKIEKNGKIIDALYEEIKKIDRNYEIEIHMPDDLTEEAQLTWQKKIIDILEEKSQSVLEDCIRKANHIRELRDSIYHLEQPYHSDIENKFRSSYEEEIISKLSSIECSPPCSISDIQIHLAHANKMSFSKLFSTYGAQFVLLHAECSESVIKLLESKQTALLREKFEANKKEIEYLIEKFGSIDLRCDDELISSDKISIAHIQRQEFFISKFNPHIDARISENGNRIYRWAGNINELDANCITYLDIMKDAPINGSDTNTKKALLKWQENTLAMLEDKYNSLQREKEEEYQIKIAENKQKLSALQSALGISGHDNSGPSQVSSEEYIRQQEYAIKDLEKILYRYRQNGIGLKKLNREKNLLNFSDKERHVIYDQMIQDVMNEQSNLEREYPNIQKHCAENPINDENSIKIKESFDLNPHIIKAYMMLAISIENLIENNGDPREIKRLIELKKEFLENYFCLSGYFKLARIRSETVAKPPLSDPSDSIFSSRSSFFGSFGNWLEDKFNTPKPVALQPNDSPDNVLADLMSVSNLDNVSNFSTDIKKSEEIRSRSVEIEIPLRPQKISVIGDKGTGKTCLVLKIAENLYTRYYISTMGVDYKPKKVDTCGNTIGINMWDVCGQERFRDITNSFHEASNIVICFDVTNKTSFQNIEAWHNQIVAYSSESLAKKVVLVGNKCDLVAERVVTYDEAYALAKKLGILYIETSAKFGLNIDNVSAAFALAPHITSSFSEPVFWEKQGVSNSHSSSSSSSSSCSSSSSSSSRSIGSRKS